MMIFNYPSKKILKTKVGQPLRYTETSMFGQEFVADGRITGCNRPQITGIRMPDGKKAREFFATVTMKGGVIAKVE